jgi:tetratricopeptide (TPR) repeat protein
MALFVKIQPVDTNKLLIIVAALAGLVAGFLLANTINRNEMTTLRAENESLKSSGANAGTQGPNTDLTQEEIDATLARADQRPDDFQTQRSIGIAIYRYGAMKQDATVIERSIRVLDRAAALKPDDYDVILTLGHANFDVGYFNKNNEALKRARDLYIKVLAVKPNDVDVRTDLGLTYFLETPPNFDGSVAEFRKSLATDPKHEKTLQFIIQALARQGKYADASTYLEQLRAVNPKNELLGELASMIANPQPAG